MERTIKITGKGEIAVSPDRIRLSMNVKSVDPSYEQTVKKSAEDTKILRNAVKSAGLNPKELKTARFSVDTAYEEYTDQNGRWKRKFIGYEYRHALFITFPNDNKLLGKILYALANCPVDVEFSIAHTVENTKKVKNMVLEKAVEDAREKAEVLTKAAGVALQEIVTIDYSWHDIIVQESPMRMLADTDCLAAPGNSYDVDIEADDITVEETVTVIWKIA